MNMQNTNESNFKAIEALPPRIREKKLKNLLKSN